MSEESSKKCEELAATAKDLQKLLSEAALQYEDLEKRYAINETTYKEHLQKKNDAIAALKKELADANGLIEALKQGNCWFFLCYELDIITCNKYSTFFRPLERHVGKFISSCRCCV